MCDVLRKKENKQTPEFSYPYSYPYPYPYSYSSRRDFTAEDAEGKEQKGNSTQRQDTKVRGKEMRSDG